MNLHRGQSFADAVLEFGGSPGKSETVVIAERKHSLGRAAFDPLYCCKTSVQCNAGGKATTPR